VTAEPSDSVASLCAQLVARMEAYFNNERRFVAHAHSVLQYAEGILLSEPEACDLVVRAAAILHDIGIPEAERKHGSAAGKFQELEGPPIARRIMQEEGIDEAVIEHVCRIIGDHHSGRDMDTLEFRIIWDSDWLVNIPGGQAARPEEELRQFIEKTFRTKAGHDIALRTFCAQGQNPSKD
jgi:HD domain